MSRASVKREETLRGARGWRVGGPHTRTARTHHRLSGLPPPGFLLAFKQDPVVPRLVPGSRQDWGEMEGARTYRGRRTQVRALPLLAENLDLRGRDKETSKTGGRKLVFIRKQG